MFRVSANIWPRHLTNKKKLREKQKQFNRNFNRVKYINIHKKYAIYDIFSNIIQFCINLYKEYPKDTIYCFVSRDGYFIKKLFDKMYPGLNTLYVYHSRNLCFNPSIHYIKYVKEILDKGNTLWIDGNASGKSHIQFFKKHFDFVPEKFCFSRNFCFKAKHSNFKGYLNDNKPEFYDQLFLAPSKSIIGMGPNQTLIYKKDHDQNEKDIKIIINTFEDIIQNLYISPNIIYRTLDTKVYKKDNHSYNGLLALDIDGTINIKSEYLNKMVEYCNEKSIKIILITARQIPFRYGPMNDQKIQTIQEIFEISNLKSYKYIIDIFYNPYTFLHNNVSNTKLQQLNLSRNELKLTKNKCVFIDDDLHNVNTIKTNGFSLSMHVKKGINEICLKKLKSIII